MSRDEKWTDQIDADFQELLQETAAQYNQDLLNKAVAAENKPPSMYAEVFSLWRICASFCFCLAGMLYLNMHPPSTVIPIFYSLLFTYGFFTQMATRRRIEKQRAKEQAAFDELRKKTEEAYRRYCEVIAREKDRERPVA